MADEAADAFVSLGCLFVDLVELLLSDVGLIECGVELTFYLGTGALGVTQEPHELCVTSPIETLCDVVWKRGQCLEKGSGTNIAEHPLGHLAIGS